MSERKIIKVKNVKSRIKKYGWKKVILLQEEIYHIHKIIPLSDEMDPNPFFLGQFILSLSLIQWSQEFFKMFLSSVFQKNFG